jgi:bifunctional DNA-binding transcriptional regulator/antitoxin component of YhaV-PrlF toxin-antitoxin module
VFGNGRIQLKKRLRVLLDLCDGDDVYFKMDEDGRIYVEKAAVEPKIGFGRYVRSGA